MKNPFKKESPATTRVPDEDDGQEEPLYDDDVMEERDERVADLGKRIDESRRKMESGYAHRDEDVVVTRIPVVRDIDEVQLPQTTTDTLLDLPTLVLAKYNHLMMRKQRKIIDEKIRINLPEENEEFESEVEEEYDDFYGDDEEEDFQ